MKEIYNITEFLKRLIQMTFGDRNNSSSVEEKDIRALPL